MQVLEQDTLKQSRPKNTQQNPAYIAAWADLKRRMRLYNRVDWSFPILWLGYMLLFAWTKKNVMLSPIGLFLIPGLLICAIVAKSWAAKIINQFRCPRCQQQFIEISLYAKDSLAPLRSKGASCLHCQLPLWCPHDMRSTSEMWDELGRFWNLFRRK